MQNEELERARAQLEANLERFRELYDHGPIGYLTLARDDTIRRASRGAAARGRS